MFVVSALIFGLVASVAQASVPGKLAVWSLGGPKAAAHYDSRSVLVDKATSRVNELAQKADIVVFLSHGETTYPAAVRDSIKEAAQLEVMPHVYKVSADAHSGIMEAAILASDAFKNAKTDITQVKSGDSVIVKLSGSIAADTELLKSIHKLAENHKLTIVAIEEPTAVAPAVSSDYSRRLAANPNYLPSGTEFTIYYNGEYLYLTPELFTGLMTMLFLAFVGFTGLQCLGAIQGPATFPTKLPPLGKEG
jgi:hypothetical protein